MDKIKIISSHDVKTPFRIIDVTNYDFLEIDGNQFPLSHPDFSQKAVRELKGPMMIDDMIDQLERHSISFNEGEKEEALLLLKQINYYRFAVYRKYLRNLPATFSDLKTLYQFDVFLRRSLEDLIEPLEFFLKTSLTSFLTNSCSYEVNDNNYQALAYLNPIIYKKAKVADGSVKVMLSEFYDVLYRNVNREPSLQHHIEYYGGNIPMWVIVEHLTIGNISCFVNYLDRPVRKRWVDSGLADSNGKTICKNNKLIPSWIETIRLLRNTVAHGGRLYSHRFPYHPTLERSDEDVLKQFYFDLDTENFKHTFFAGLVVIRRFYSLLSQNDKNNWNGFIIELSNHLKHPQITTERLGLPSFELDAFLLSK